MGLRLPADHPKSCSLALGITGLNAALYIALYVGWLLRVWRGAARRARGQLQYGWPDPAVRS